MNSSTNSGDPAIRTLHANSKACLLGVAALFAILFSSWAHGDLHLRIQAITREIETATTNKARLYLARGELQREHGDLEAAARDFQSAAEVSPELALIDFCRGRLFLQQGKLEEAKSVFDKGLKKDPSDGEALIGRAKVQLLRGQTNSAIADLQHGVDLLSEPDPDYYLLLAKTLSDLGKNDDAVACLDQGVKKLGPNIKLLSEALELELSQGKQKSALNRVDIIIQNATRKESWLSRQGQILMASGQRDKAREAFEASHAAIRRLPPRLQQSPGMKTLVEKNNEYLSQILSVNSTTKSIN